MSVGLGTSSQGFPIYAQPFQEQSGPPLHHCRLLANFGPVQVYHHRSAMGLPPEEHKQHASKPVLAIATA